MIFVTVGTHTKPFDRLLKEVDRLVKEKKIKEKVIMQIGNSTYKPKYTKYFKFTTSDEIDKLNKKANVVITHGGAGSLLKALGYEKKIVAVPRLKKFDEHVNDHQIEIVRELEKSGKILAVYDINNLLHAVKKATKFKVKIGTKQSKIAEIIRRFIHEKC